MKVKDQFYRFVFNDAAVRGEIVQLKDSWQAILDRHEYPPVVRDILGQAMAATVLLGGTIKFLGSITLQIHSNDLASMLVVQVKTNKTIRAMASYDEEVLQSELRNMFNDAKMVITIEMDNASDQYQGIIELGGKDIATALEEHLRQSEQLETRLWLAVDEQTASGFLLQKMPGDTNPDKRKDDWNRVLLLANTLKDEELKALSPEDILHRLYHEDNILLFTPDQVEFACTCTKEKIEKTLHSLGYKEVKDILSQQGSVEIDCHFCNQHYEFDSIDVETMFNKYSMVQSPDTRH